MSCTTQYTATKCTLSSLVDLQVMSRLEELLQLAQCHVSGIFQDTPFNRKRVETAHESHDTLEPVQPVEHIQGGMAGLQFEPQDAGGDESANQAQHNRGLYVICRGTNPCHMSTSFSP